MTGKSKKMRYAPYIMEPAIPTAKPSTAKAIAMLSYVLSYERNLLAPSTSRGEGGGSIYTIPTTPQPPNFERLVLGCIDALE